MCGCFNYSLPPHPRPLFPLLKHGLQAPRPFSFYDQPCPSSIIASSCLNSCTRHLFKTMVLPVPKSSLGIIPVMSLSIVCSSRAVIADTTTTPVSLVYVFPHSPPGARTPYICWESYAQFCASTLGCPFTLLC